MTVNLTILDGEAEPIQAGLHLELLRDGVVVARGTTTDGGVVTFEESAEGGEEPLSIRIAEQQPERPSK
jgi:hypothetical protein